MAININGKTVFMDLEGGFWGISTDSEDYLPINFPEQLKQAGMDISCGIEELDIMTSQNWGVPCRIISFSTG